MKTIVCQLDNVVQTTLSYHQNNMCVNQPSTAKETNDNPMNERERFIHCMRFEPVDRVPLMEMGLWDETLERWHDEGLPLSVTNLSQLEQHLHLDRSFNLNWLPLNCEIYPAFDIQIIHETESEITLIDGGGVTSRQKKHFKSIPQFIRFPVENEADYEKLLPRLDGKDPGRYASHFDAELQERHARDEIIGIHFPAFFGFPRGIMGLENWCMAFYDQPHLVKRIIADRVQFAKDVLARALDSGLINYVQLWEDMAYNAGPLLSPRMVNDFMRPAYEEVTAYLHARDVKLVMVDCDGRVNSLLPIYRQAGIDGTYPCEIAAGADPYELRRANPGAALMGGVDKRIVAQGKDGVDSEMKRLTPLIREGAFIPMIDHFVPPDIDYATYCYYVERRREILSCI